MAVAWAVGAWATNSWVGMNGGPPNAWRGATTPVPIVTQDVIRNFSLRNWRLWKKHEDDTEKPEISEQAALVIESVARRQIEDTKHRLDEAQRLEELARELELRNIAAESAHFKALAIERENLIDAEIQRRLMQVQRNKAAAITMMILG